MLFKILALLGFLCLTILAETPATNITSFELFNGTSNSSNNDVKTLHLHGWCTFYAKVWEQCDDRGASNVYLKLSYIRDEHGNEIPGLGKPVSEEVVLSGSHQWADFKIYDEMFYFEWKDWTHVEYHYGAMSDGFKSWRDHEQYQCKRRKNWGPGSLDCKNNKPWVTYRWYDVDCGFTC
ncbi:hypothetical protein NX059_003558 [Plenodomus lindquistii]|nr:hypothetical protein NX059_003558 [Plenodomus lindquistii]